MRGIIVAICTGLGLGFSPVAPGTVGTLLGLPFIWLFPESLWLILGIIVLGTWSAHRGEKYFGCKDSPQIVIDEIAGFMVAAYGLPHNYLIPAFILFRFFDIAKPGPIRKLQELPGGWGVMIDDVVAGLLTNLILHGVNILY